MPKLTTDQLHFIDTYLKNSGVEYVDIRYEMTDHIACALEEQEGDFMENFKRYMAQNKSQLLIQGKAFAWKASRRAVKHFFSILLSWYAALLFLVLSFISYKAVSLYGVKPVGDTMFIVFLVVFLTAVFITIKGRITADRGYSVAFKALSVPCLFIYVFQIVVNPLRITSPDWLAALVDSFYLVFILAVFVNYIVLTKKYKVRYAA
ncbi:hypothetical protein ACLI08_03855 [Flavobacterium sp. RNTU_13]|uniref:hypothetical protein n=1 Tax=Flavobacterium sp. RNTU_13 TaxID=3375145 RepID=UPI003986D0B6